MGSGFYEIYIRPNTGSKDLGCLYENIYEHSINGIMIDNDALMQDGIPNSIWDCGLDIKDGNLIMSGGVGPGGYGEAIVKIPLDYFEYMEEDKVKDRFWFYIECDNESDRDHIINTLITNNWVIEKVDES